MSFQIPSGAFRTTGIQNDLRLPGTTSPRVRSPWLTAKEFTHQDYPLEATEQGLCLLGERDRIQFLGLNSAWEIDEFFRERSSIHPGALTRVLDRADQQAQTAIKDKRINSNKDLIRIAVWHHPPTGNDKIYAGAFVEQLRGFDVRLCLHGHVHEDRLDVVCYIDPRKLYVAGAGSFGAGAPERPESTPRLYNLLEVLPDRSKIRVHTRCLRKEGGAWEGWAVWPGENKSERRTFYEIPLD